MRGKEIEVGKHWEKNIERKRYLGLRGGNIEKRRHLEREILGLKGVDIKRRENWEGKTLRREEGKEFEVGKNWD